MPSAYLSFNWVVVTEDQLNKGALARSTWTHDGDRLTGFYLEIEVAQDLQSNINYQKYCLS